ncbi:unnamed protein product, partial [Linum tenue]
ETSTSTWRSSLSKLSATRRCSELSVEERNLLSVAYKNVIGSLRAAWRIVSSIEQKEEGRRNDEHAVLVKDYRSKIETELSAVCAGILAILDSNLVPSAVGSESKVFYLKMKGDYHRYMAEFKVGDERKSAAEDTMLAYKAAQDIALADLAPTHPIRLGLALNFSVFYYEILNSSEKACTMAKQVCPKSLFLLQVPPCRPKMLGQPCFSSFKIVNLVLFCFASSLYTLYQTCVG